MAGPTMPFLPTTAGQELPTLRQLSVSLTNRLTSPCMDFALGVFINNNCLHSDGIGMSFGKSGDESASKQGGTLSTNNKTPSLQALEFIIFPDPFDQKAGLRGQKPLGSGDYPG
jgi:hypothetical protein